MSARANHIDSSHFRFHSTIASVADRNILDEASFHRMLSLETKRGLRSQKPFLLSLFKMDSPFVPGETRDTLDSILSILDSNTRDTDVTGWYVQDAVLGVMFTEMSLADQTSIVAAIMSRMSSTLRGHLSPQRLAQLTISFQICPREEVPQITSDGAGSPPLFTEGFASSESSGLRSQHSQLVPVEASVDPRSAHF